MLESFSILTSRGKCMLVTLEVKTLGVCNACANALNSGHLANMQISTKLKPGSRPVFF